MRRCTGCGAHVSAGFWRVFADRDGTVLCPGCNDLQRTDFYTPPMGATYRSAPP